MIDFSRAIETAWQRMTVILFQPLDLAKWGLMGFSAFLAFLAEGGVSFNNPVSFHNQPSPVTTPSLSQGLHAFKQFTTWLAALPDDPWLKVYLGLGVAYAATWLVLTWVGCRGEFVFLDNIVRNRAALAWPWKRYERQGNVWFVFHLGLVLVMSLCVAAAVSAVLYLNWSWINAERSPTSGEIGVLAASLVVVFTFGLIGMVILFQRQTLVLPLYFTQTRGLGSALLEVLTLTLTRPVSIFAYVVVNMIISIAAAFVACVVCVAAFCVTCGLVMSVSCFPFVGTLLMDVVICQLFLPIMIFKRCFQLGCLEQFGPRYDVFRVDAPVGGGVGA